MVIVNENGEIVLTNSQAQNLFGYTRHELLGRPVERLLPGRFKDRHLEHREAYFEDPRVRPMGAGMALHAVRKDGCEFPVEISLSPPEDCGRTSSHRCDSGYHRPKAGGEEI